MSGHHKDTFKSTVAPDKICAIGTVVADTRMPDQPAISEEFIFIFEPTRIDDLGDDFGRLNVFDAVERDQIFCFLKTFDKGLNSFLIIVFGLH